MVRDKNTFHVCYTGKHVAFRVDLKKNPKYLHHIGRDQYEDLLVNGTFGSLSFIQCRCFVRTDMDGSLIDVWSQTILVQ